MTEKERSHSSEQDDFLTKAISSLKKMRQDTTMLTQSLGLPGEAKYDVLATHYDQNGFDTLVSRKEGKAMTRHTLRRDYSEGKIPSLAIIRAQGRYQLAQVSRRENSHQVVFSRFLEGTPRTRLREARADLQTYVAELRSADRQRVLREARAIVQAGHVGLDTETTGLKDMDQIVSWAIVGSDGEVVGHGLVRASVPISESARQTHHIREEDLVDAPGFGEAWAAMKPLLAGNTVLAFGVDFDIRLIKQTAAAFGVPLEGLDETRCYCVSEAYAAFRGEPDKKPERRYRRHKLAAACVAEGIVLENAHDAVADARATVQLLQALAQVAKEEDGL